jgi:transcription antitermination factor NusG
MAFWAIAQTKPRQEKTASYFLTLRGFVTYVPHLRERCIRRGRKVETIMPLFPSYIFLLIESGRWYDARWCPAVVDVLTSDGAPARVANDLLEAIRQREIHNRLCRSKESKGA